MNTSKSEGTSWGKQFQLNLITSLIWFLFFKYRFPFTHMLPLFQGNFILGDATSSHFFQSNYFDKAVTFSGSHFFRTAAFFSFFRTVTFSQELFFQYSFFFGTKLLEQTLEQTLFENKKFFTAVILQSSYFFWRYCKG